MIHIRLITGQTVMIDDCERTIFISCLSNDREEAVRQLIGEFFPSIDVNIDEIRGLIPAEASVRELVNVVAKFAATVKEVRFYPLFFRIGGALDTFLCDVAQQITETTLYGETLETGPET